MITSNSKDKKVKIIFIALHSLTIRRRWFIFSALDFNITYTYSAGVTVPFGNANVCVFSFSHTYWNNNYFCPLFFSPEFCS